MPSVLLQLRRHVMVRPGGVESPPLTGKIALNIPVTA
jgi:hypothetical protein